MNQQTRSRIPPFETCEEEAEFWDTHDTTEFEDEFEPIEVSFARSLIRRGLTVSLDPQTVKQLRRLSRDRKMEPAALVRLWIMDRLQTETVCLDQNCTIG
jgi:hypothetical protein